MTDNKIKARLNLNAVLRNLEELPALDKQTMEIIRDWNIKLRQPGLLKQQEKCLELNL